MAKQKEQSDPPVEGNTIHDRLRKLETNLALAHEAIAAERKLREADRAILERFYNAFERRHGSLDRKRIFGE